MPTKSWLVWLVALLFRPDYDDDDDDDDDDDYGDYGDDDDFDGGDNDEDENNFDNKTWGTNAPFSCTPWLGSSLSYDDNIQTIILLFVFKWYKCNEIHLMILQQLLP